MDRVLEMDAESGTARIQAGVMGPHLEQQLNAQGFTLGHFPDSFLFSTLGGWIATRSAGMQSDRYGKIEDMVAGAPHGDAERHHRDPTGSPGFQRDRRQPPLHRQRGHTRRHHRSHHAGASDPRGPAAIRISVP